MAAKGVDRITPARAGKSLSLCALARSLPDHPRTRGEKGLSFTWYARDNGSPPHARGKVLPP